MQTWLQRQTNSRTRIKDPWTATYVLVAAALIAAASANPGYNWLLHQPFADIWQHLAAINAIVEAPFAPSNPFVDSDDPSRLFGPLWVAVGFLCRLLDLTPLHGFRIGGVINLLLLAVGIWTLGTSLFGNGRGAIALLAAMLGGWLFPPNFTGYHSPLTLLSSPGYPAITAVAAELILWGLCWRGRATIWIPVVTATAFITHPLGTAVALAGCAAIILFGPASARVRQAALIGVGLAIAATWPYFNPWRVLLTASQPTWGVGIDFYSFGWLLGSLFPAVLGLPYLLRPHMRPFLLLLLVSTAGFAAGTTEYFIAGHRLLSWMALLLHIGLAGLLLEMFSRRSRMAAVGQAVAVSCLVLQGAWTYSRLQNEGDGNLLAAARPLARDLDGGVAAEPAAAFALAATGTRVLATPFSEPLVGDMGARQRASDRLFGTQDRSTRLAAARRLGVRYLVVDAISTSPATIDELSNQAVGQVRSGRLIRFQLY